MDFTLSPGYATHPGTGQRLHRENQGVPTAVSELDLNSIIWSMMEVVKTAELAGVQFDADMPPSYQVFRNAIQIMIDRTTQDLVDLISGLSANALRTGDIIFTSGGVTRPGCIKGAGQLLPRASYPELYEYAVTDGLVTEAEWTGGLYGRYSVGNGSTTFRIPDYRAMVLRALDDGRGIDAARARGSYQADQNKAHDHTGTAAPVVDHTHGVYGWNENATNEETDGFGRPGAGIAGEDKVPKSYIYLMNGSSTPLIEPTGGHGHAVTTVSSGGSEVRMVNIAVPFLIKF